MKAMLTFNNITADSFAADTQQGAGRRRPRHREALSCSQCRERKVRCDRKQPCRQCQARGHSNSCSYGPSKDVSAGYNITLNTNTTTNNKHGNHGNVSPDREHHQTNQGQMQHQNNQSQQQSRRVQTEPSSPLSSTSADSDVRKRLDRLELMIANGTAIPNGRPLTHGYEDPRFRESASLTTGNSTLPVRNALQCPRGPLLSAKTRFIGGTHWLAACNNMTVLKALLNKSPEFDSSNKSFMEVKEWARSMNAVSISYSIPCSDTSSLFSLLPSRATCESWIRTYRQTYRHVYDIVDELTLDSVTEKVWGPPGSNDDPTVVCIVILLVSVGMQCSENERLNGRGMARHVEQFASTSALLQKPCIGSMIVLLLLTLLKTISCSDAESLDSLSGIIGLTSQLALSMGLHRNPSTFGPVSNYHSEVRKRLWSVFFRLHLEYCMRAGVPMAIQPEDTDVGLPANINLTETTSDAASDIGSKDLSIQTDATFSIVAARLAAIAAPYQRAVCSAGSNISPESIKQLRDSWHSLLTEAPNFMRPNVKCVSPTEEIQRAFLTIGMDSMSLTLSLHFVINVPPDSIQKQHLFTVWDHALAVLHSFQVLAQKSRPLLTLAYQLLWSDACRAAFSASMALNRLRVLECQSIMTTRVQHTLIPFQQTLLQHLTFMAGFWLQSAHLGPTASKNCLLLAVVVAVTSKLFSDDRDVSEKELLEVGIREVERTVDSMKAVMKQRHHHCFPLSPDPSISSISHPPRPGEERGRSMPSPSDGWPANTSPSSILTHPPPSNDGVMDQFANPVGSLFGSQSFIAPEQPSNVAWTSQEIQWPMDGFDYSATSTSMSPVSHVPSRQTTATSGYVEGLISPPIAGWAGTSRWVEDVGMSF